MSKKILIIDEDQTNLALFDSLIQKISGCEAFTFHKSKAALDWAKDNIPDLVIVEYGMPDINGIEIINSIRAMPGRKMIPILIISGSDQKQIRYKALEQGANDFLTTPVDKIEFLARAKNMLSLNHARKQLADHASWLAGEVRKATKEVEDRERETVFRLSMAAEYRDPETGAHILRMANFSKLIARELKLSKSDQQLILEAAPMHDIGKVGIPDNILLKPGKLDPKEFEIMKKHAIFGFELLNGSSSKILQAGAEIARGHHEKFDGSGYPYGLKGEAIPIFSRIVAVADVFDALTSERPYKKAWPTNKALDMLVENAGKHFDPYCVQAFINAWDDIQAIRGKYKEELMTDLAPLSQG
jgi:putative two-component system response regulator